MHEKKVLTSKKGMKQNKKTQFDLESIGEAYLEFFQSSG